jgi:hypothetical protein
MSKMAGRETSTAVTNCEYKIQIMAIKIHSFRSWIESRLTELLEGLEDEILWSLVFNYLEDAQKKAKREGPAANPSGSLSQSEITTALTGFLGAKAATTFVNELFSLLQKAQENGGIPPEFAIRPEVAEKEAFSIINEKRREMDISDRVKREISRNDRYNERSRNEHYSERSRRDDRYYDSSRRDDRYYDSRRDNNHYDSRRDNNHYDSRRDDYHNDSRHNDQYNDSRRDDRYNDSRRHSNRNYYEDWERSSAEYHKSDVRRESHRNHNEDSVDRYRSSRSPRSSSDHRSRSRNHRDSSYRSENDRKRRNVTDSENEGDVDEDRNNYRYRRRSPIKSSSPESAHETWESETTSKEALPRAPNVQETVSSELEQALRAKALLSMAKAKQ